MQPFETLFRKSNGQPVLYDGRTIRLFDRVAVRDGQKLKIVFEGVNADWRQGVSMDIDGSFEVNEQNIKKSIVLWHDTAPREVVLKVRTKKSELLVNNVWDTGNGLMHSGHNGAAMIVEETASGRRYKCNDGLPDDDFDDLVFRIEFIK